MKKENSTNSINDRALQSFCKIYKVLSEITGRWKVSIIIELEKNEKSYSDLKSNLPNITDRILTKQLKELVESKIIINEKNKIQSNYFLSEKGKQVFSLLTFIKQMDF